MWKRGEGQGAPLAAGSVPKVTVVAPTTASRTPATIGPTIVIRGDVTGTEDILIQGQVDGSVTLAQHAVRVGTEGHVKAKITGKVITIEGKVEGDLTALEHIVLRGSAHVQGKLMAPRVVIEDGATFIGLVDMSARDADAETGHTAATDAPAVDAKAESPAQLDTKPGPTSSGSAGASRWSKPSVSELGPSDAGQERVQRGGPGRSLGGLLGVLARAAPATSLEPLHGRGARGRDASTRGVDLTGTLGALRGAERG